MLTGKHYIAGEWMNSTQTFTSEPAHGPSRTFCVGTPELVDRAANAAEDAFASFSQTTRAERAAFLNLVADEIDALGEAITEIGTQESGLPEARLQGERGRTVGQLRVFAEHILAGKHLDLRHDMALPDRAPLPRPDIKAVQRPIGPVAVFGASNFPLAFSVAGGDTASALAAGCPVVVKGHSAHPGTSELVGQAIAAAVEKAGIHPGVFSLIQGGRRDVGSALVEHPAIRAVGFTGSLAGGRALFDLCASRPDPIPFFGELGSVNPMFLMPHALTHRGSEIAAGWAGSLTMGAGQFCTNPGIAVVLEGGAAETFAEAAIAALGDIGAQTMLTDGIADAYRTGVAAVEGANGVDGLVGTPCRDRSAAPYLFRTTGASWLDNEVLAHEVFGPLGIIVVVADIAEMLKIAASLEGQLTATLHLDPEDESDAAAFVPVLERKAGRLLANGFPTGVEVSDAMVHGGPYPASTNFGHTSVGTLSIRRFLRPVSYQNMPDALLPADLLN